MVDLPTCAIATGRDRSGRMLSAGTALASSRRPLCGIFGHVLFPQDKEGFGSITSHEENCFVFSRSHRPSLTRTSDMVDVNFCTRTTIANGSKIQYQRRKYTETPGGGKASARPRSAVARGGSPAAPESVVYFRSGKRHQPPLILLRILRILFSNNNAFR